MKQILRVTGQPPEGRRDVIRDLRVAINEVRAEHGPHPDILYLALGEDYMLDVLKRLGGSDYPPIHRDWASGGFEILGYPVYLDVDLAPGAFQVVWTR